MRAVHADLLERVSTIAGPAVVLDTPYGFQENADEISARTAQYFAVNVGHDVEVARWPRPVLGSDDADPGDGTTLAAERVLDRIRSARFVFAGPGSPTYALRRWRGTGLADALRDVLRTGGCVTFASAAALTLGTVTVPVYEIYKAGLPPAWEPGLDIFSVTGLRAAVIPHFDNAEGGTHDTRFCYLGERRLRYLESRLPDDTIVLGVDEHTACIFDLDRRTAEVAGRGGVTVRRPDGTRRVESGRTVDIDALWTAADDEGALRPPVSAHTPEVASDTAPPVEESDPLVAEARRLDEEQRGAVAARDVDGAVAAILELEQIIEDWSADTLTGTQRDQARSLLRGMIVRLGGLAAVGAVDPRERVAPLVEAVLRARADARSERQFALADRLRDALSTSGVEVRDTADGSQWMLRPPST